MSIIKRRKSLTSSKKQVKSIKAGDVLQIGNQTWFFATDEFEETSFIRIVKPTHEHFGIKKETNGVKNLFLELHNINYSQMNLEITVLKIENVHLCDMNVLKRLAPFYLASCSDNEEEICMMNVAGKIINTSCTNTYCSALLHTFISKEYIEYNEEKKLWQIKDFFLNENL